MARLHAGSGLRPGWMLFVTAVTDMLEVFDVVVTHWMTPYKPLAVELSTMPDQRGQAQAHFDWVSPS